MCDVLDELRPSPESLPAMIASKGALLTVNLTLVVQLKNEKLVFDPRCTQWEGGGGEHIMYLLKRL